MTIGLVAEKCGMTRVFTEDGTSVPVTVVMASPNRVTQLRTLDNDGYRAVQVTAGTARQSKVNKPRAGHFAKAGVDAGRALMEFRLSENEGEDLAVGAELKVDLFQDGQWVDVTGVSKGKGFAGVVKRYHFKTQDATHGNSLAHRAPGSIGQCQFPGHVFKGKKMAGQMGNVRCSVQNQRIFKVDAERNLLLIRGTVPGAPGSLVVVKPAVKKREDNR